MLMRLLLKYRISYKIAQNQIKTFEYYMSYNIFILELNVIDLSLTNHAKVTHGIESFLSHLI